MSQEWSFVLVSLSLVMGIFIWKLLSVSVLPVARTSSREVKKASSPPSTVMPSSALSLTPQELSKYDGSDPKLPIYIAIKGVIFDVSKSRSMYTKPAGYSVFSGKDASRALGSSSLKPEDCVSDYSNLSEEEMQTLDKWFAHYEKKYEKVGTVSL